MASPGMSRRVTLVTTDVSEECIAYTIRVRRIGELGTTLAVTTNRSELCGGTTLVQEPHGPTSQKTAYFIVSAAKTSNLTEH
jgi:hypothetical protein